MASPISLSIIIPSNDLLIKKDYISVYGKGCPLVNDSVNDMWITTIYYSWDLNDICSDINRRLLSIGVPDGILDVESPEISIVREGICIMKDRIGDNIYNPYHFIVSGLSSILENKLKVMDIMNQNNRFQKEIIMNRMENFITRLKKGEKVEIDKEKKELNEIVKNFKNMGASKDYLREIGKKTKAVYIAISDYIELSIE